MTKYIRYGEVKRHRVTFMHFDGSVFSPAQPAHDSGQIHVRLDASGSMTHDLTDAPAKGSVYDFPAFHAARQLAKTLWPNLVH